MTPPRRGPLLLAAALLALGAATPVTAATRRVEVPLVIPPAFLERLLVEQVFTDSDTTARIVTETDPCNEIVLSKPALRPLVPRLFVTAHGVARAGFPLFGSCWQPFRWEGEVEAEVNPRLERDATTVAFEVSNSWLSDESDWLAVPALWDWLKPAIHPRLEVLRVDLAPLLDDLRRALPLFAERRSEAALRRLAASLSLTEAHVDERGLVLSLRFEVEAAPAAPAPAAAPLGREELDAFTDALHEWDAFLTFVIRSAGEDTLDPALRTALLAVLIDARYEIVAALAEPRGRGEDRVRALFVRSWRRLQPTLVPLSGGSAGLRYLAFVAAGDALAALDAAGPAFGFEISADGLRRLARTLVPDAREDPLRWSEEVDPALRATFGFEAELPAVPAPPPEGEPAADEPPEAGPAADEPPNPGPGPEPIPTPQPAPTPESPAEPAPTPTPEAEPPSAPEAALTRVLALAARWADSLLPAAFAAPAPPPAPGPESSRLDGVAPRLADLDEYLPAVEALLHDAAGAVSAPSRLEPAERELFTRLTLATAWQESCWRQYVRRKGRVTPLRSNVGALGVMQVNPHVWRGFYAVDGLAWSIRYNARAGSEILLHYLRDYAMARGEEALGGDDALARASYAAYHGGPSHLRRYREPRRWRRTLVAVDRAFLAKYREVVAGRELGGVRSCYAG